MPRRTAKRRLTVRDGQPPLGLYVDGKLAGPAIGPDHPLYQCSARAYWCAKRGDDDAAQWGRLVDLRAGWPRHRREPGPDLRPLAREVGATDGEIAEAWGQTTDTVRRRVPYPRCRWAVTIAVASMDPPFEPHNPDSPEVVADVLGLTIGGEDLGWELDSLTDAIYAVARRTGALPG